MYIPQDALLHPVPPPPHGEPNSAAGPALPHRLVPGHEGTAQAAWEPLQRWITGRVGPARAVAGFSRPRPGRGAPWPKRAPTTEHDLNVRIGIIVGVLLGVFLLGTLAFCYVYRFSIRVKSRKRYRRHHHHHHHRHHSHSDHSDHHRQAKSTSSKSSASSDAGGPPPDPAPAPPPPPESTPDPAPESAPEPAPAPAPAGG